MGKNEIHARLSPELMQVLKRICNNTNGNLSDVTRAALVLYVDAYECPHLFERHKLLKSQNSLEIGLIGTSLETTRATPDLVDELSSDIELEEKDNSVIQIIEQEFGVFFARCRDEYDPEDGELYWFWFESKDESLRRFDADSPNNWCPTKRFKSQKDAIKDYLRHKLSQTSTNFKGIATPDLRDEFTSDDVIDW